MAPCYSLLRGTVHPRPSASSRPDTPLVALARYYIRGYALCMVLELKLRKVGNSVGVVLPKEALARLNVAEGDTLTLTDSPDGSLRVTPATEGREQFAAQMKAAEGIVRRYRNTLRELAQ